MRANASAAVGKVQPARAPIARGGRRRVDNRDLAIRSQSRRLPWPVAIFLVSIIIPWIIPVGPLGLSAYRIVLIVALLPCLVMWRGGKAGPIRAADISILLFCLWAAITLVASQGIASAVEPSGILLIETMGAYLLARCYIRDANDFANMIALVTKLVILLLPFALYEWNTGNKPLLVAFGKIFPTVEATGQLRSGLWRVQGPFEHSILFGLFCGSVFALAIMVSGTGRKSVSRGLLAMLVPVTAFLSMSSAPVAGLIMQGALMLWNRVLRQYRARWKLLGALVLVAYLIVEFGSNQTPVQFYISKFTFDQQTGWVRLLIWQYGSASVLDHPLFGVGFGNWARPGWMPDSIDNFWLLIAIRHGIPGLAFMLGACLWIVFAVSSREYSDEQLSNCRTAYLICMVNCLFVGTTVHFWAAPYVWFLFLLGSGVWLLDVQAGDDVPTKRPNMPNRDGQTISPRLPGRRVSAGHRFAGESSDSSSRITPAQPESIRVLKRPSSAGVDPLRAFPD